VSCYCVFRIEEQFTLEEILIFFIGADLISPLGFPRKARLYHSDVNMYLETSTCGLG